MNFSKKWNKSLFLVLLLFSFFQSSAQKNFSILSEPSISLSISGKGRWSYDFGVSDKQLLFVGDSFNYEGKYVELSHFTNYKISDRSKLGIGLRHRLKKLYDSTLEDETSIMAHFGYSKKYSRVITSYRVQLEERIGQKTALRSRYKFSLLFPLNKKDDKGSSLGAYTESLWSVAPHNDPSFEQRTGAYFERALSSSFRFDLGLEYRANDYTRNTQNELFLVAAIKISI